MADLQLENLRQTRQLTQHIWMTAPATGMVLSRQVWAMTPSPAQFRPGAGPEWAAFCTLDNLAFWSDAFDMQSSVAGVIQVKPLMPAGRPPIDSLLRLLLRRSGVHLRGEPVAESVGTPVP